MSFLSLCLVGVLSSAQEPPNIVLILADDLGYGDPGCYNDESKIPTPHIDRLASEGLRLTDAHSPSSVCTPTRYGLLTGRYAWRTDLKRSVLWPWDPPLLEDERETLPELLRDAGYRTAMAGKWHLGPEGFWPEQQGFDINKGDITRGGPYGGKKYFAPYGNPRLDDGPDGEHLPLRLGHETAAFINDNRNNPFLAVLSFYSVHTPLLTTD